MASALKTPASRPTREVLSKPTNLCRTKAATIFAIGDVTGKVQLAHLRPLKRSLRRRTPWGINRARIRRWRPSDIHFARGRLRRAHRSRRRRGEARNKGWKVPRFSGLGKGLAAGETTGLVKWIADAATKQLLGAAAVGPHATELIAAATTAIRAEFTARELGETIHAHPTFAEAWMEAAHALRGEAIHAPPRRR